MKKILVSIIALMAVSMGANAQYAKLYKGTTLVGQYSKSQVDKVEFSNTPAQESVLNGHAYVEIGGKKWSTMNLGATTVAGSYNTCYGVYYAWGTTDPYLSKYTLSGVSAMSSTEWKRRDGYTILNAAYCSSEATEESISYTKYTSTDGKTTLDNYDDAAIVAWGGTWRMPSKDDFLALYAACGGTGGSITPTSGGSTETTAKGIYWCTNYNGVAGILFCDGTNKLFFPAAGYVTNTYLNNGGGDGLYYSSSVDNGQPFRIFFSSAVLRLENAPNRYTGVSIRPVSD